MENFVISMSGFEFQILNQ